MENNNRFIVITKTLRKYGILDKNGALLKKSLSNLTFTTQFEEKDDCKYFGNRILGIIDTKTKKIHVVDTSNVNSISKTNNGFIVEIECNLLFSDFYETLTRDRFDPAVSYTTLFNETHYMFGAFDVYNEVIQLPNTTNHNGIYMRPRTTWPYKRLCEFRDGNAVFMAVMEKNNATDPAKAFRFSSYPSGRDANTQGATSEGFRPDTNIGSFDGVSVESKIGEYIALK